MITVKWTGQHNGNREFRTEVLANRFAEGLKRTGYKVEIVDEAPAETPAKITGRAGKGLEVHEIVAGVAACGSSYRSRKLGGTLVTKVTGEEITCRKCANH